MKPGTAQGWPVFFASMSPGTGFAGPEGGRPPRGAGSYTQ
jgi:hypothetical protein